MSSNLCSNSDDRGRNKINIHKCAGRLSTLRKNMALLTLGLVCLLVVAGATSSSPDTRPHPDAGRRPWGGVASNKTTLLDSRSYRPAAQHHQQKWRESTQQFRASPKAAGATEVGSLQPVANWKTPSPTVSRKAISVPVSNSLREVMRVESAGESNKNSIPKKKRAQGDDEDEDKKTLSQQIADGKYGLIQKEIYPKPPLRPGVISYAANPEVPRDTVKNLGGLDAEEIWLAEDHVLVLRGGWFPNHVNRTGGAGEGAAWPPIDNYVAPPRQVKLPARPKVPPPFPVQLKDGGPTHFIGPNGTKSLYPFPPPFFPFPPGDGFYPPPGNESLYPLPPYPYPGNETYPQGNYPPPPQGNYPPPPQGNYPPQQGNYPPQQGNYPNPPDGPYPYPPPPHGYMPFPNGTTPFGPLPPFFPPLPPGAAFLPPPANQTEYDEDDPSIYYPPPYDFFYPQDNTTSVPPGPLVPGIILPPPPHFFAPLDADKPRAPKRPASTPLPHVPLGVYPPSAAPKPKPQYHSTPRPIVIPQYTPRPPPPSTTTPSFYYPLPPRDPTTTPLYPVTSPPTSTTPYGHYVAAPRPTIKRPYLSYVPVTTAQRKKKPRPTTTTPRYEYEITRVPVVLQATISSPTAKPPQPPTFVSQQQPQQPTYVSQQPPQQPTYVSQQPPQQPTYVSQQPPQQPTYVSQQQPQQPTYVSQQQPQQPTYVSQQRPQPPKFVSPQHVQVFHKGESPIIQRPFYYDANEVTPAPEYSYNADDNVITSTPHPNYITEGLGKLKDILYTTPRPTPLYPTTDGRRKQKVNSPVTTVETVKSIEYTTESPLKYYSDFTRTPIYVKDFDNLNAYNQDPTTTAKQQEIDNNSVQPTRQPYRDSKAGRVITTQASLIDSYQPNQTPKTHYFFYDEPQYTQGYVREVPPKQNSGYRQPKWQYENGRPSQRPTYNVLSNVKTEEEQLLAQIAETLRQPSNGFYYNSPVKQSSPNNYYNANVRAPYYPNSKPLNAYSNSSPRPGFYITRKPEYFPITTPSSYNPNAQGDRDFPYSFEDVIQSTERPPPQLYMSTQRPRYQPTRLAGPDITVQTSPKTVYEYSYQQKQPVASSNYVTTERPKQSRLPSARHPQTTPLYYEYSQSATPVSHNQIYQSTTPKPARKYPAIPATTPDPIDNYFTHHDDTVLDDITKKYFTIFGQKLRNDGGFVPITTPLPPVEGYANRPQGGYANRPHDDRDYPVDSPTQIPLYDDVAVNYRTPRPPLNPDSEFINPHRGQYSGEEGDSDGEGGGKLISYKLPGNEGGHFYFVTPQVVKPS